MRFKAVIFDLDGTLLDTIEDIAASMNEVLERHGFPPHRSRDYPRYVGSGLHELVQHVLPVARRDAAMVANCARGFEDVYARRMLEHTRPYPGVPELLDALHTRGMPMAILSNKPDGFTRLTVSVLLGGWTFAEVRGAREGVPLKPDPASAVEIAASLRVPPAAIMFIGDSGIDMQTARNASMYAIGVLWGFRPVAELMKNGAKVVLKKPRDLIPLIGGEREGSPG
ncbi:MAG: HAD family hydrolase [Candidatus Aureabacteria bacterium]|nr:HAD family hydrolase [Candidatus Auribacterota bacterium]